MGDSLMNVADHICTYRAVMSITNWTNCKSSPYVVYSILIGQPPLRKHSCGYLWANNDQ